MADEHRTTQKEDEVILCVRYTSLLGWLCGSAAIALSPVFHYVPYGLVLRGEYLKALVVTLGLLMFLAAGVDFFLTKHLIFYRDRLVKVRHFFGQRTIPYARAKLLVNPRYVQWMAGKSFSVIGVDDSGRRAPLMQIPIAYSPRCVSRESAQQVEALTSYLLGLEDSSRLYEKSRLFEKSTFPKEVLCQDCQYASVVE